MTAGWRTVAIVVAACALASAAVAQSPDDAFAAANAAYQAGRHEEAADGYRSLIARGIHDARVEYNLGCAAFKLGRLGEAILHYARARRLAPGDREISDSLEVAGSRVLDRIEQPAPSGLIRAARSAQDALGPDGQFAVLLALVWALAGTIAWGAVRPGGFPPIAGWSAAALAAAAAITAGSWWFTWQRLGGTPEAVVLAPAVEVLSGPGGDNPALFSLHEGTTLEIRGEHDAWMQVSLPNGLNGWVPRDAVERI